MDELVGYGVFPELMQSSREKGLLPKLLDPEVKYGEFSLDLYFSPFRKGQIETIVKLAKEERIDSDLEQKIEEAKIRIFWELNAHIAHLGLVLYNATALSPIFHASLYIFSISSTLTSFCKPTVFDIAPDKNG